MLRAPLKSQNTVERIERAWEKLDHGKLSADEQARRRRLMAIDVPWCP